MDLSAVFDPFYEASSCAPSKEKCRIDGEEEDEAEDEAGSKARESKKEDETNQVQQGNILDAIEYPLLQSLGFCKREMVDRLIQELVKFSDKQCISFKGANNRQNALFLMPSCQTRERYEAELQKRGSTFDRMMQFAAENSTCSIDEAAECILNILFYKFENTFADVAIKKNIVLDQHKKNGYNKH